MGFGAIGLVGGLLSSGVEVYGALQQGQASKAAAKYNNQLAIREAENIEAESAENIRRQRINNRRQLANLRARAANSGILTGTGTPAAVLADAVGTMEVGIADAARSASIQAQSARQQGQMGLWEAKQTSSASRISAFSYGVAGLTKAASTGYQNYRIGSK